MLASIAFAPQPGRVHLVLESACSLLVLRQMGSADDRDADTFDIDLVPSLPGFSKSDAINGSQDVNATRSDTNLENDSRLNEIILRHVGERRTEACQRSENSIGIRLIGPYPQVDVSCGSNKAVGRQGVGPNQEVLNPLDGEGRQYVAIVGI